MKKAISKGGSAKVTTTAKDVGAYLAPLPREVRITLEKLRQAIKAAAPQAEEVISYRIPTYKHHGPLVHFMVHPNHCSFVTVNRSVVEMFKKELAEFDTSGTTIHFTPEHPLPASLVTKIVKARMKENEAKASGR